MGKHGTYHLSLGQVVKCWVLAVMFIAGYQKCLTLSCTPHWVSAFVTGVSLSYTGLMKLKTRKLSAKCIYLFIYSLSFVDMEIQGDTHGLLIHLQMAEIGVHKGLNEKETLRKALCNNKNNYTSKLANIKDTLN